ncbi:hypothetical protein SUGI_1054490 [Cryptomeria japonica]|nr:hypothetical protein SUGI_1054490 [Cryptomeria japonica]
MLCGSTVAGNRWAFFQWRLFTDQINSKYRQNINIIALLLLLLVPAGNYSGGFIYLCLINLMGEVSWPLHIGLAGGLQGCAPFSTRENARLQRQSEGRQSSISDGQYFRPHVEESWTLGFLHWSPC